MRVLAEFFLFSGIEFLIHGLRESEFLVLKHTHQSKKNTWYTHAVVAPAFTYANKSEGFARLPYKSIGISDFVKPLKLHGF